MIIELHLLQSFPVSNLNRDDIGQPKTVRFGGYTRGRISSQCLKKAARGLLPAYGLQESELGWRTKRLADAAAVLLASRGRPVQDAAEISEAGLESLGFAFKNGLTQYLLYVGKPAGDTLAGYCDHEWDKLAAAVAKKKRAAERSKRKKSDADEPEDGESEAAAPGASRGRPAKIKPEGAAAKEAERIFDATRVADIALFGRMIADNTDFNITGACQVAHAISTHAVATEFDYYTALDDLKPTAEPGADMLGTVDFNAACYYRYANLDLGQLAENLPGDPDLASRAARAWLHAFIRAVPGAKQNSMAASTVPEVLLGVARQAGSWSLSNAFLRPVADVPDIMAASAEKLVHHFGQIRSFYGTSQLRHVAYASLSGESPDLANVHGADTAEDFVAELLATAGE
jgi:CRISPR system Cascade subunit CasC